MLRENLEVIHDTEANHHDLKQYLSKKENQELNIFKAIKEIKEIHDMEHKHDEKIQEN